MWGGVGGCLLLWKGGFAKRKGGGKGGGGLGWVGEEWRKKGLGWVGTEEYTLGDCEKPHIALVVVWDIYAYLIRLDMICEPFLSQVNVVSVFSVRARSRTGFFSIFRSFFFCLARVSFFERERESMGLFCLLGSRLVKSVKFSRSLICNPTFSISFLVPSLRPCLCNPPPPQPIVIVIIIIIIDSLKPSHKPL